MADMSVEDVKNIIIDGAARVASEGNGVPLVTFMVLAEHVISNLVCYRQRPMFAQDVNYLARMLQSVYVNLQDAPMEIE